MVPADHPAQADPETSVTSIAWNGRYLFAGLAGGRLQVWNDDAWLVLDRIVDTRPCYDSIILGLADGSIELRHVSRGLALLSRRAAAHGPAAVSAAWVDEQRLVTGDDQGRVKCWELRSDQPGEDWDLRWHQEQHEGRIVAINHGGGGAVLTAALDGRIVAWDAETGDLTLLSKILFGLCER
eukprot:Skav200876  [mRNA]  locus=scaffold4880:3331:9824:+ [translate_table: standard]